MSVIKEVLTLTSNVEDLKGNVARIDRVILDHHERIVKLEAREELITEKCKNAAITAVGNLTTSVVKEVTELSIKYNQLNPPKNKQLKR
jgi:hypothetical protein